MAEMRVPVRFAKHRVRALWLLMLVALAGLLNVGGVMSYGETLSHMTGNLTKFGSALSHGQWGAVWLLGAILLSFLVGATLSGFAFPQHTASQWRRCGVVLVSGGALLLVAQLLPLPVGVKASVLALVLGAQNGLAVRYRGVLARTTHVTGHLTDCGAALGRTLLRVNPNRSEDARLFAFHLLCLLAFLVGAAISALAGPGLQQTLGVDMVQVGAVLYILGGVLTWHMGKWAS